jgi:diacylglycerol kinase family enzyme
MLDPERAADGRSVLRLHDEPEFALRAIRPVAMQIDGEYVGEREFVRFVAVPNALSVVA